MRRKLIFTVLLVFSFLSFLCCSPSISKHKSVATNDTVYFIPALHNYHALNTNYSYDTLRTIIERIQPDIIAVEIRAEDINSDTVYLKKNYPLEMRQMKYWFPKTTVLGFDWLGEDLEGKSIPEGYWKNSSFIKKMQRELAKDSLMSIKLERCYTRNTERETLLKTLSLPQLIKSQDAEIVNQQYECYNQTLLNTPYAQLVKFYEKRNQKILENITSIVEANKNKRILILTGDDHYVALKNKFNHTPL